MGGQEGGRRLIRGCPHPFLDTHLSPIRKGNAAPRPEAGTEDARDGPHVQAGRPRAEPARALSRLPKQTREAETLPLGPAMKGEVVTVEEIIETVATGGKAAAIGLGIGVALLFSRNFRPLAKQAVKGYLVASEGMRRAASGAREGLQDIYAEAKAEQEGVVHTQIHAEPGTSPEGGTPASGAEP